MKPVVLAIDINAPLQGVWDALADLRSHPEWMGDAGTIVFVSPQTSGVGTEMRVPTRVGPFRATDLIEVVEWEEGRMIAVEHVGTISGTGRFEIQPSGEGTRLRWSETLRFPWWLGGPLGARLARPVLKRVWRGNLDRLARRLEVSGP